MARKVTVSALTRAMRTEQAEPGSSWREPEGKYQKHYSTFWFPVPPDVPTLPVDGARVVPFFSLEGIAYTPEQGQGDEPEKKTRQYRKNMVFLLAVSFAGLTKGEAERDFLNWQAIRTGRQPVATETDGVIVTTSEHERMLAFRGMRADAQRNERLFRATARREFWEALNEEYGGLLTSAQFKQEWFNLTNQLPRIRKK